MPSYHEIPRLGRGITVLLSITIDRFQVVALDHSTVSPAPRAADASSLDLDATGRRLPSTRDPLTNIGPTVAFKTCAVYDRTTVQAKLAVTLLCDLEVMIRRTLFDVRYVQ